MSDSKKKKWAPSGPLVWVREGKAEHPAYLLEESPPDGSGVKIQWASNREEATVNSTVIRRDYEGRSSRARRRCQGSPRQGGSKRDRRQAFGNSDVVSASYKASFGMSSVSADDDTSYTATAVALIVAGKDSGGEEADEPTDKGDTLIYSDEETEGGSDAAQDVNEECSDEEAEDPSAALDMDECSDKDEEEDPSAGQETEETHVAAEMDSQVATPLVKREANSDADENYEASPEAPVKSETETPQSVRVRNMPSGKKTRRRQPEIDWSSSDDDSVTSSWSQPTPKKRSRKSAGSCKKTPRTRVFFTEDEDEGILAGVEKHGKGNWTLIKRKSGGVLKNRSATQIKDRYRQLTKHEPKEPKSPTPDTFSVSPKRTPVRKRSGGTPSSATSRTASSGHDSPIRLMANIEAESPKVPDIDLPPKNVYPDRDTFYAALEVYNRMQLNGPGKVSPKCRVFVCRSKKFFHVTPCWECGNTFDDENRYLVEFRPWLNQKLCEKCAGNHLEKVVGTEKASIYSQLEEIRAEQPYPVYTDKHLHKMGGIDDMVKHQKVQAKKEPGPCTCSRCTCECSYCWSENFKPGEL